MTKVGPTPKLLSMATRAAQVGAGTFESTLVTEHFDGVCVQAVGVRVTRNTLDGMQPTVQINWFIDCKRASRKKVYERFGTTTKETQP